MAGTGLIDFAGYDYPWALVVLGWVPIAAVMSFGYAALWLDVKRESTFDWRVAGGFAVLLHLGALIAQVLAGQEGRGTIARLRVLEPRS